MAKSTTPARDAVLVKYLNEAYGKETQLETALKAQIALASRPTLKKGLEDHLKVTKAQARGLKSRIRELGGKAEANNDGPGIVGDAASVATAVANKALAAAKGPVQALRGTSPNDNELRNVRDCYWNEAEEIAHYTVIEAVAEELGDKETAKLARQYRKEEERMQALLEREIPKIIKAVVKDEVPREERPASNGSRGRATRSSRSSASSNGGAARKTSARKASARKPSARKPSARRTSARKTSSRSGSAA